MSEQKVFDPGATVRVVTSIGNGVPRAVYATVLSVAPILAENLGVNGEPTLTVAFMDDPSSNALGKIDWHQQFQRHAGVRHASHSEVAEKKVSLFWVDVLPPAGKFGFLPAIEEIEQDEPVAGVNGDGRIHGSSMIAPEPVSSAPSTEDPTTLEPMIYYKGGYSIGQQATALVPAAKPGEWKIEKDNALVGVSESEEAAKAHVDHLTAPAPVKPADPKPATPSAEDLDKVVAEEAAKNATAGAVGAAGSGTQTPQPLNPGTPLAERP